VVAGTLDWHPVCWSLRFSFLISGIRIKELNVFGRNLTSNVKCNIKVRLLLIIEITLMIKLHVNCVQYM